jgi:hypothetical protein
VKPRRSWLLVVGVVLVALLVGGRWLALETAERAWAHTVGGGDLYLTARRLSQLMRVTLLVLSVGWGTTHLWWVYRAIGSVQMPRRLGDLEIVEAVPQRLLLLGTILTGLAYGVGISWGTGDYWLTAVLAASAPRFGIVDPVLQRDLGYYVGELPWQSLQQEYVTLAVALILALVAFLYVGMGSLRVQQGRIAVSAYARSHLGFLAACLAATIGWGALLDPAEVVAGLHGPLDHAATALRIPGAGVLAVVAFTVTLLSLAWSGWGRPHFIAAAWLALVATLVAVYGLVPAIARSGRSTPVAADSIPVAARAGIEALAYGTDALRDSMPPPSIGPIDSIAQVVPLWDARRVVDVVTRSDWLGPHAAVAAVALDPAPGPERRPVWLVAPTPDETALEQAPSPPTWREVHTGRWTRAGAPIRVAETDTGLAPVPQRFADSTTWFGTGFAQFALVTPDSWPALHAAAIPLEGWWRRAALAWALQSAELARAGTAGDLLLWRREAAGRLSLLAPFAHFDPPIPVLADGSLWWVAYGYVTSETFPLARPVPFEGHSVRYVHAGFVGAVAAATGRTRVTLAPGYDSLSAAWARRFAPLVQPLDSLPPSLRARLPFPRGAFGLAATALLAAHADSATGWTARPPNPYEITAPDPVGAAPGGALHVWMAQGFETTKSGAFTALLAGVMTPTGPRLTLWTPVFTRLPAPVFGAGSTTPGELRLWTLGGALVSVQAMFFQPESAASPRVDTVYLSWGDRKGGAATRAAALRSLLTSVPGAAGDTSLGARWITARRLAEQADSALAAGDLPGFSRLYARLTQFLGVKRRQLAPPSPRR